MTSIKGLFFRNRFTGDIRSLDTLYRYNCIYSHYGAHSFEFVSKLKKKNDIFFFWETLFIDKDSRDGYKYTQLIL